MEKVAKALVLGSSQEEAASLLVGAKELGEEVLLVALSANVSTDGADRALVVDTTDMSVAQIARSIVRMVEAERPDIVLAESGPDGRLLAGCVATVWGESAHADATNIRIEADRLYSDRMVYGGNGIKTESSPLPVVVCVARGEYQATEVAECKNVEVIQVSCDDGVQMISVEPCAVSTVDLGSADIVVGVGRGVQDIGMKAIESFASSLTAEIACTRPIAEEVQLLPKERYVGISGQVIKPKVYVACGISGQAQHLVGIDQSDTVIAVNKDKNAPIFKHCDVGIVGDVAEVLPMIASAL